METLRLDKWLWQARFFKSRSLANRFCRQGSFRINGRLLGKTHATVKPGDVLTFNTGPHERIVEIIGLGTRRGPATEAKNLYKDISPPRHSKGKTPYAPISGLREPGAGRPTKAERRATDKLKGRP